MSEPSAQEVLMLALINRARLDPAGEAARDGIDLNEGLPAGTLSTLSSQPLAFSDALLNSSESHSQAMIDTDFFAHTNPFTGSTPQSRADAAGYVGLVGENISWTGTTGAIDPTASILQQAESLFVDSTTGGRGHRLNILDNDYQDIGIGQVIGVYTAYNTSMVTEDFGIPSAGGQSLTGIAYNDTDANAFYSVGEGRGGIQVAMASGNAVTGTAGAYAHHIDTGVQTITFSGGDLATPVIVKATIAAGENALVDLINTSTVETSVSLSEVSGVSTIIGRGTHNLSLTGAAGAETLMGSSGNDTLNGAAGADHMIGGNGNDISYVDNIGDIVDESGTTGVDKVISWINFSLADTVHAKGNIENLQLAGTAGINGAGNALANIIIANNGDNALSGGAGNDKLVGGIGADRLAGGLDADTFIFHSTAESTVALAGRDVILDFSHAQSDKIDLSLIDAQTNVSGDQAFHFIGTGNWTHHSGELRYQVQNGNVLVYGDVNGDGNADFAVQLNHLTSIAATDFHL